jgi:predicted ATPase/class 3 adenylate cyclase/DNA-binding CsgD family transcriptional regulator
MFGATELVTIGSMDAERTQLSQSDMSVAPEVSLPEGTVTLLLTDVEGSTRLWESSTDAMAAAIDRHYRLMDAAVALHNGVRPVEQGEGDSVVAAFRNARDAIACGLDVQRAFAVEPWPDGKAVRLRMAIHTGEVMLRDSGNYFGPAIIRCARLRALAHGGQILVSSTTRALVADVLTDETDFVDLGSHRLKDLDRPERVWQLVHPDLERDFPALRSFAAVSTNLPTELSSFVGREREVLAVADAVAANRLVTLTGAGGCGKTRLAYAVGAGELDRFADGVWCVELAAVRNGDLVAHAIAGVFGLREEFGRQLIDTVAEQLHDLQALLIVDNCEQVSSGAAVALEHLLKHAPGLKVLATSREPLGLAGETTWRVPSLEEAAAAALFVERAQSVRPGFAPTAAEGPVIAGIVARLDGIPLAVELAAARVRMMSPDRIAAAIDDRFRLLTGGHRTAMPRQQTLEASVAWSYDLLDESERVLARRLSVMHGFTLEAAEAIACDAQLDRYAVLDLLTRLVDKSIVQTDVARRGTGYRILETVRQYLQGRLVESGDADAVRARHLAYFVDLAERCAPIMSFRDSPTLLMELEVDHDNLDTALEFADTSDRREEALRLATALTLFWELKGHLGRAGRWFARLLDQPDAEPSVHRARACWGAAHIGLYGGDFTTMSRRAPEALELAELVDDDWARARALNTVGFATAMYTPAEARAGLKRSVALGERIGDAWSVVDGWKMISVSHWIEHDEPGAEESLEALRVLSRRLEAGYFLAWYHGIVGFFTAHRGDLMSARTHLETSIEICDGIGEPITGTLARSWLASVAIAQGDYEATRDELTALLGRAHASGGGIAIEDLMTNLGEIELASGNAQAAVDLLEPFVDEIRETAPPYFVAWPAVVLASAKQRTGDLAGACELLDTIAELIRDIGSEWMLARVDLRRGSVALERGELEPAERLVHAALAVFVRLDQKPDIAPALDVLGHLAVAAQSDAEAVRCFAAADALRAQLGIVPGRLDATAVATTCTELRMAIGDDEFESHWREGAGLTLVEAVGYVSRARGERKRPQTGWASLTPTEARVVELVGEGLTNPQIAEKMFIARGTVKVHLSHIFAKVGASSRAELAAGAARRSMSVPPDAAPRGR